jgi:hypothetical protein
MLQDGSEVLVGDAEPFEGPGREVEVERVRKLGADLVAAQRVAAAAGASKA